MDTDETQTDETTQAAEEQQDPNQNQETTPNDETLRGDPVLSSFLDGILGKQEPQEDVKPAPDSDGEGEYDQQDPGDPSGEEEEEPAPPKVKVVKRKSIQDQVREEIEKTQSSATAQQPQTPQQQPAQQPAQEQDEEIVLDGLSAEEQDYLDILNYAAKKAGHKYVDARKKFADFVAKRNQIRDRILKDDPDADLDEVDTIRRFTEKNRPTLSRKEIRDIERMQIREEVSADFQEKYDKRFADLDARGKKAEVEPVVNSKSAEFSSELVALAKDAEKAFEGDTTISELVEAMDKEGVEAVRERNPLFADLVVGAISSGTTAATELIRLMSFAEKGLNVYDEANPTHRWLTEFIIAQDSKFASTNDPRKVRVIGGVRKSFVPQAEFAVMPPENQAKHWTFSTDERLRMIKANTIMQMRHSVADLRKKLEASGWTKKQIDKELGSQSQNKTNKEPSPKVKQSVAPGPARGTQQPQSQSVMSAEELATLGLTS